MSEPRVAVLAAVLCLCSIAMHSDDNWRHNTLIVAQRAFKDQTGNIQRTTLFTPAKAGTYRISIDVETNYEPAGGNGPNPIAYWTNDFSAYESQIVVGVMDTNGTNPILDRGAES